MLNKKVNIDFSRVKYENVKVNIKNIIENFCIHSFFQHFLENSIPLIQIYYFIDVDFQNNYNKTNIKNESLFCIFCLSLISLQMIYSFSNFIHEITFQKFSKYFLDKKYYDLGDLFRKVVIITEILNVIFYFPLILTIYYFLKMFLFYDNLILLSKIYDYHYINFFALMFYCFSNPLSNMLYVFKSQSITDLNFFFKFVVNVTFCRYFKKKSPYWYFMNGIAFANVFGEIF
jgi:hypothetical protein